MLIEVKKQTTETMEVKAPCCYKGQFGDYHYINEAGQLITVRDKMIFMWEPTQGKFYSDDVEKILLNGKECAKEEFDNAYAAVMARFENVIAVHA